MHSRRAGWPAKGPLGTGRKTGPSGPTENASMHFQLPPVPLACQPTLFGAAGFPIITGSGSQRPPEMQDSQTQVAPWRDLSIVVAITLVATFLAAHFELNEAVFSLTRQWEHFQLDEWPVALLVLAVGLGWLSWRRYQQT